MLFHSHELHTKFYANSSGTVTPYIDKINWRLSLWFPGDQIFYIPQILENELEYNGKVHHRFQESL
jgi:hypothetical protein